MMPMCRQTANEPTNLKRIVDVNRRHTNHIRIALIYGAASLYELCVYERNVAIEFQRQLTAASLRIARRYERNCNASPFWRRRVIFGRRFCRWRRRCCRRRLITKMRVDYKLEIAGEQERFFTQLKHIGALDGLKVGSMMAAECVCESLQSHIFSLLSERISNLYLQIAEHRAYEQNRRIADAIAVCASIELHSVCHLKACRQSMRPPAEHTLALIVCIPLMHENAGEAAGARAAISKNRAAMAAFLSPRRSPSTLTCTYTNKRNRHSNRAIQAAHLHKRVQDPSPWLYPACANTSFVARMFAISTRLTCPRTAFVMRAILISWPV